MMHAHNSLHKYCSDLCCFMLWWSACSHRWGVKLLLELLSQQLSLCRSVCPFFFLSFFLSRSLLFGFIPSQLPAFSLSHFYLSSFLCPAPSSPYLPPLSYLFSHRSRFVAMAISCFASLATHSTSLCPWTMSLTCALPSAKEAMISCDHSQSVRDQNQEWATPLIESN